jgi:hypothetical protein
LTGFIGGPSASRGRRHDREAGASLLQVGHDIVAGLVQRERKARRAVELAELGHLDIDDRHAGRLQLAERRIERRLRVGVHVGEHLLHAAQAHALQRGGLGSCLRTGDETVVLGRTNLHELAFGISGFNPAYNAGPEPGVRNAYDKSKSAGGSSSGTGAALGARVVLAGLGTDTGGSVRIPCAFNGCASLRPTVRRLSAGGHPADLAHARHRPTDGHEPGRCRADRCTAHGQPPRLDQPTTGGRQVASCTQAARPSCRQD